MLSLYPSQNGPWAEISGQIGPWSDTTDVPQLTMVNHMVGNEKPCIFFYVVLLQVYRTDTYITYSTGIILTLRVLVLLNNTYITVQLHYLLYCWPIYNA